MPKLEPARIKLLEINKKVGTSYHDIDMRLAGLLPKQNVLTRPGFVQLPYLVQKELVRSWLVRNGVSDIDKQLVERITLACKTLPIGKKTNVSGGLWLYSNKLNLLLSSVE